MAFICPDCKSNTLDICQSLELPPDSYNDELTLQVVRCAQCGFHALAVYEESRHGSLDSESWHHQGYRISEEDFQMAGEAIQRCPHSGDMHCRCLAHRKFGQMGAHGWDGLRMSGVKILGVFNIQA